MRVLFLQRQPCIRAMKYASGLRAAHPEISLAFAFQGSTLSGWYGTGDELFDRWFRLPRQDPATVLAAAIDEFRPDLIHSHNLPDTLTVLALDVAQGRVPVVHDVHDMQSLRRTPYEDGFDDPEDPDALESAAVEGCSALVAVSREMLDEIERRHRPPPRTLLFANYALGRDLAPESAIGHEPGRPPRVVYQGSLSANGSHYDLRDQFAAIAGAGLPIDVFPNRDAPAYHELATRAGGLRVRATLRPAELLRALPPYDVGWAAFNTGLNAAHLDTALPNKAFEYLASGLPIAAGRHRALARLVAEHGVGVVVDDPRDLAAALEEAGIGALRARVAERRHDFTVEGHIGALVELYRHTAATAAALV
jgi:glycosyltransferase involved in cell wall biosynthesis